MLDLISATLIYDGAGTPVVPTQLWPKPRDGKEPIELVNEAKQLQGKPLEKLCEIAGRACYDSLGRGRDSAGYHQHILEVGHLSVLEHAAFTVRIEANTDTIHSWGLLLLNKPAAHVEMGYMKDHFATDPMGGQSYPRCWMEVTVNLRHVLEWDKYHHVTTSGRDAEHKNKALGRILRHHAHKLAPQIVAEGDPLVED